MKASLLLLLPAMLLALAEPQPSLTPGCEPGYWFREQITIEQVSLPDGISLHSREGGNTSRAGITLENHTSELLFVLSLQYQEQLTEPATPDPAYAARLRYAHEVASYLVAPEGARPLTLDMSALLDLDPDLQERNRQDASRPTGTDAAVPQTQNSMLLMVLGEQVLRVPFTLTYTLNPDYASSACGEQGKGTGTTVGGATQSPAGKSAADLPRGLGLLALVAGACVGAYLVARLMRRL
jgi:hypothetical protein